MTSLLELAYFEFTAESQGESGQRSEGEEQATPILTHAVAGKCHWKLHSRCNAGSPAALWHSLPDFVHKQSRAGFSLRRALFRKKCGAPPNI